MKRKLSFLLILIGVLLLLYPTVGRIIYKYKQSQLIGSINTNAQQEYAQLQDVFLNEANVTGIVSSPNSTPSATKGIEGNSTPIPDSSGTTKPISVPKSGELLGTLYIEKFGLELKIVEGASEENLEFFIGHLTGTSAIGQIGNTAIAGHRSHVFGNFFNRLDELVKDDEILIEANGRTYRYIVYETLIVKPDDVSVLKRSRTQSVLTLITCHPLYISSHRLIIHAVQVE